MTTKTLARPAVETATRSILQMRVTEELLDVIDAWRIRQKPVATRSAAALHFIALGIEQQNKKDAASAARKRAK